MNNIMKQTVIGIASVVVFLYGVYSMIKVWYRDYLKMKLNVFDWLCIIMLCFVVLMYNIFN